MNNEHCSGCAHPVAARLPLTPSLLPQPAPCLLFRASVPARAHVCGRPGGVRQRTRGACTARGGRLMLRVPVLPSGGRPPAPPSSPFFLSSLSPLFPTPPVRPLPSPASRWSRTSSTSTRPRSAPTTCRGARAGPRPPPAPRGGSGKTCSTASRCDAMWCVTGCYGRRTHDETGRGLDATGSVWVSSPFLITSQNDKNTHNHTTRTYHHVQAQYMYLPDPDKSVQQTERPTRYGA